MAAVSLSGAMFMCPGPVLAEGETLSVDPTEEQGRYTAVLYDNTNGLPTSEANAIIETSDGFIWIGSYSGLIRYDGNSFERYDSTSGIASIVSLFEDSHGRLWVGTNDSGAALMDRGNVRMFNRNDGLTSLSIRAITEDSAGLIYLATTEGVAVIDTDLVLHMIEDDRLDDEYIVDCRMGPEDVLYGVTMTGKVFTITGGAVTGFYDDETLGISDVHAVLPDPDRPGYVYMGTRQSEIYYGDLRNGYTDPVVYDISPTEYVNSMELFDGNIWVCADSGIGFVRDGIYTPLGNIPMVTSVEQVITDYQNNLWFVSSKQGVMKIVPNQFADIFSMYGIEESVINATCIYDDMLFIGGKDSGLTVTSGGGIIDDIPVTSASTASGVPLEGDNLIEMLDGARIRSIIRDSQDRLWFCTFGETALLRYDHGTVTVFGTGEGLPSQRIRTVLETSDGRFLVACTGGAAVIENDEVTTVYDESYGLTNIEVLTVAEGNNGDILIGTDGGGIYIIKDGNTQKINTSSGLSSDVVMRIKKSDTADIWWIVTSNSICCMSDDYSVTMIDSFPYSNNFDVYENGLGDVWVLSSNGIYVETVEDMISGDVDPVFYGIANGLPCITTANSYSALTPEGMLYIAGTTGVARVNIKEPFESVSDLRMAIPYVDADGVIIYPGEDGTFTIPSGTDRLTIYSFVFTYSLMDPQVTYMLDGFDKEGTTVRRSALTPVVYTNLRGGEYRFVMDIADAQGRGNQEISVTIVKARAFYETPWFYMIITLAVVVIIYLIVHQYIEKKTEEANRKTEAANKEADRTKRLVREIVGAFAKTIDMKDKYTTGHSARVSLYTVLLARELGCDEDTVEKYRNIAMLHDIGKIGIPIDVLNKPGKLDDDEFALIRSHAEKGEEALKDISLMPDLALGAGCHHERPDGKGYPKGLAGEDIPEVARIIAVADTFDAMYSDRPYRKCMDFEKAVSIIQEVSGTQLDETVVAAFMRLVESGKIKPRS